jgi:hypothetical protein
VSDAALDRDADALHALCSFADGAIGLLEQALLAAGQQPEGPAAQHELLDVSVLVGGAAVRGYLGQLERLDGAVAGLGF